MSAMSLESVTGSFGESLAPIHKTAIGEVCRARGFEINWHEGLVIVPGQLLHARCADLPLPPGFHLSIHNRDASATALKIVQMF